MSLRERAAALSPAASSVNILTIDVERQRGKWEHRGWDPYPPKHLRMDTMVSRPYIMSFAAKWLGSDDVLYMDERGGVPKMVAGMRDVLNRADVVITYNGERADIPWMNEEFLHQGLPPAAPFKSIDLFKVNARRMRQPYRSLAYLADVLDAGAKTDHSGMDLWAECEAGNPEAWALMEKYNRQDVVLTEAVYLDLLPWLLGTVHMGILIGDDQHQRCPNCGSVDLEPHPTKHAVAYVRQYQLFSCANCRSWVRGTFLVGTPQHTRNVR